MTVLLGRWILLVNFCLPLLLRLQSLLVYRVYYQ